MNMSPPTSTTARGSGGAKESAVTSLDDTKLPLRPSPKAAASPEDDGASATTSGTSSVSEDQRSKMRARHSSRIFSDDIQDAVSVSSIDEDVDEEPEGDDADDVAALPTLLYAQDSKANSAVAARRESSQSVDSDEMLVARPTELSRASNHNVPPAEPGAVRMVMLSGMAQHSTCTDHDDDHVEHQPNEDAFTANKNLHVDEHGKLVHAQLIDEEPETHQDVLTTKEAVQAVNVVAEDKLKRERRKRNICIYGAIGVILIIVIIVVVVVSNALDDEAPPTSRVMAVPLYVEDFFGGPIPPVEDYPSLPQARAIDWLIKEDTVTIFPFESEDARFAFYERYVAAVLGFVWKYENWNDSTNWLDGDVSTCEWQGLSCNDDGRITSLDLAEQNLHGSIPSEIGVLKDLDFMFLFRNSLTGYIPTEVGNLNDVEVIFLNENLLSGSIPNEMSRLEDIDELYLFGNMLTGSIPESFGDLSELVSLCMNDNQLSGTIPRSLIKLKGLQRLYLNDNRLVGEIPTELGGIYGLQRLQLENNALTGSIHSELGSFLALSMLTLQGNDFVGSMPDEVCSLRDNGSIDNLQVLEADCLTQVSCDCCTACF